MHGLSIAPLPPEGTDYLHEVDYPEVMRRDWFIKGIQRLLAIADEQTTAIVCSEENPAECHRHHLIAKYLFQEYPDIDVRHIPGDGNIIVGVASGIMDQFASAASVDGSALLLDCRSLETTPVSIPGAASVVVMDTGVRRSLAG